MNFQGLSAEAFGSATLARGLLLAHAATLLAFAHLRWLAPTGGLPALAASALGRLGWGAAAPLRSPTPRAAALLLLEANLIGIAFARSLHFQFYAWYALSLPLLAWSARLPGGAAGRLLLLALLERIWNVYPPTRHASLQLHACHTALLIGLLAAPPPEWRPAARGRKASAATRRKAA